MLVPNRSRFIGDQEPEVTGLAVQGQNPNEPTSTFNVTQICPLAQRTEFGFTLTYPTNNFAKTLSDYAVASLRQSLQSRRQ
jgi:hypothetical protein